MKQEMVNMKRVEAANEWFRKKMDRLRGSWIEKYPVILEAVYLYYEKKYVKKIEKCFS